MPKSLAQQIADAVSRGETVNIDMGSLTAEQRSSLSDAMGGQGFSVNASVDTAQVEPAELAQSINVSKQDVARISALVDKEVSPSYKQENPEQYDLMVKGVVDTVLNRVASPQYPDTVKGVIDQEAQFTPVTEYGSVDAMPEALADTWDVVNGHLTQRSLGAASTIGDFMSYANPPISDEVNQAGWVGAMVAQPDTLTLGTPGDHMHAHGQAGGARPPGEFTVALEGADRLPAAAEAASMASLDTIGQIAGDKPELSLDEVMQGPPMPNQAQQLAMQPELSAPGMPQASPLGNFGPVDPLEGVPTGSIYRDNLAPLKETPAGVDPIPIAANPRGPIGPPMPTQQHQLAMQPQLSTQYDQMSPAMKAALAEAVVGAPAKTTAITSKPGGTIGSFEQVAPLPAAPAYETSTPNRGLERGVFGNQLAGLSAPMSPPTKDADKVVPGTDDITFGQMFSGLAQAYDTGNSYGGAYGYTPPTGPFNPYAGNYDTDTFSGDFNAPGKSAAEQVADKMAAGRSVQQNTPAQSPGPAGIYSSAPISPSMPAMSTAGVASQASKPQASYADQGYYEPQVSNTAALQAALAASRDRQLEAAGLTPGGRAISGSMIGLTSPLQDKMTPTVDLTPSLSGLGKVGPDPAAVAALNQPLRGQEYSLGQVNEFKAAGAVPGDFTVQELPNGKFMFQGPAAVPALNEQRIKPPPPKVPVVAPPEQVAKQAVVQQMAQNYGSIPASANPHPVQSGMSAAARPASEVYAMAAGRDPDTGMTYTTNSAGVTSVGNYKGIPGLYTSDFGFGFGGWDPTPN